jgi:hypothetical protein
MNKANQSIINTLSAMGCKPVIQGDKIKVNAPTINDQRKDPKNK